MPGHDPHYPNDPPSHVEGCSTADSKDPSLPKSPQCRKANTLRCPHLCPTQRAAQVRPCRAPKGSPAPLKNCCRNCCWCPQTSTPIAEADEWLQSRACSLQGGHVSWTPTPLRRCHAGRAISVVQFAAQLCSDPRGLKDQLQICQDSELRGSSRVQPSWQARRARPGAPPQTP